MSHKTTITRENKWTTPFWSTNIEEWKVQDKMGRAKVCGQKRNMDHTMQ